MDQAQSPTVLMECLLLLEHYINKAWFQVCNMLLISLLFLSFPFSIFLDTSLIINFATNTNTNTDTNTNTNTNNNNIIFLLLMYCTLRHRNVDFSQLYRVLTSLLDALHFLPLLLEYSASTEPSHMTR